MTSPAAFAVCTANSRKAAFVALSMRMAARVPCGPDPMIARPLRQATIRTAPGRCRPALPVLSPPTTRCARRPVLSRSPSHVAVSSIVCASGRIDEAVRDRASAGEIHERRRLRIARGNPQREPRPGDDAAADKRASSTHAGTGALSGPRPRATRASTSAPIVHMPSGLQALNVPALPASTPSRIHAARSRASMNWTGRSRGPGTSAASPLAPSSPGRRNRATQYAKRSVGSKGPTMSPGRTTSARSRNTARISSSQHAFSAP